MKKNPDKSRIRSFFPIVLALVALPFLQTPAFSTPSPPAEDTVAVEDVLALTMGGMRGHKMLYDEGWTVVSSSKRAFSYAKNKSIISSKNALERAVRDASRATKDYKEAVATGVSDAAETGKTLVAGGTKLTGEILATTQGAAVAEMMYARESFQRAMDSLVRGNLSLAKRTEDERRELMNLPGNYFSSLKNDFSNIHELAAEARKRFAGRIDPQWEKAFEKASAEFRAEYEKSGTRSNSLTALGPILYGYLKAFYHGLAAPSSKTIVKTAKAGVQYGVFLPVASTAIVAGRTVQSVGLTVYYTGKAGVNMVTPTLEGGVLAGMSLLSAGAVPITYAAGGTVGAINQVAFSAAGPVAGVVEGTASTAVHSAAYVGFLAYDAVKGTTTVVINQAASGIVLGYNALTAIPTHAAMGVLDTAVFLAWDGPRLVIAAATGKIKSKDDRVQESHSLGDLPVGTVVDLKQLENREGVKVEVLSTDPAVIRSVLEKIPDDVRETGHDH